MIQVLDKIIDKLADFGDYCVSKVTSINDFLNRKTVNIVGVIIMLAFTTFILTQSLYQLGIRSLWLSIPSVILLLMLLIAAVIYRMKKREFEKAKNSYELKSFQIKSDEIFLKYIYTGFINLNILTTDTTPFEKFYKIFSKEFDDSDVIDFNATQPQLKYILDKFKGLNRQLSLPDFERSGKILRKGKGINIEALRKKFYEYPPKEDFIKEIDSIFKGFGV